jgi:hypothetical protein
VPAGSTLAYEALGGAPEIPIPMPPIPPIPAPALPPAMAMDGYLPIGAGPPLVIGLITPTLGVVPNI